MKKILSFLSGRAAASSREAHSSIFPLLGRGLGGGLFFLLLFSVFFTSCEKDAEEVKTFDVTIQLEYPPEFKLEPAAGVVVTLRNTITGDVSTANTNATGAATFTTIAGLYEATASEVRTDDLYKYVINGTNSNIAVTDKWTNGAPVALLLTVTPTLLPDVTPKTYSLVVQLEYAGNFKPEAGVNVSLKSTVTGATKDTITDAAGAATFTVVPGIYTISVEEERSDDYFSYLFSAERSNIAVTTSDTVIVLSLTATAFPHTPTDPSPYGKLVIKELYVGGCQRNDGSGAFIQDSYIIVYNNSSQPASIKNLSLGGIFPSNAHASNYFWQNGELTYANEGWLPAHFGIWTVQDDKTLAPGEQIVIAINGAIDHTITYSNSVNLANADYYACYDIEKWSLASYYPAPSDLIPTSHYLKAYKFAGATGTAWLLSTIDPAAIIFTPRDDIALNEFTAAPENLVYHTATGAPGNGSQVALKVPTDWVLDGIDVYQEGNANNKKRLTPGVDVGNIEFTNNHGHTLYRNVDKTATEAILGNAGKLVYDYSLGFEASTDPSGIDAEASIRNGAHIIYQDTNNSTNDFHQRSNASLRN